ncbi:hypothetical protein ANO11243_043200 [Dothideomycetidae sp. 11243]|nr:hypothetical protein ANO11243_043200 [fungal sp. No.11243]
MEFQQIAPTLSIILVSFLNIASQILFRYIDPAPLTTSQTIKFNIFTAGLFICYFRTWLIDPGRIPKDWHLKNGDGKGEKEGLLKDESEARRRWCRKCEMPKPPRAHHCRSCGRCIPKMDHHCPWTANCVSHRSLPHFIRFLIYGVLAAGYLEYFLWVRLSTLYSKRHLPSYLGPSVTQLSTLFVVTVANTITLFGVGILMLRTLWCIGANTTTIEGWELERHETLLRRARYSGGMLDAPDGSQVRIERQEFPYDIGIWSNVAQAMGSPNPLVWMWPFAASLPIDSGLAFPENGIEDEGKTWPPPDPDRMFATVKRVEHSTRVLDLEPDAFRRRQEADLRRREEGVARRKPFYVRLKEANDRSGNEEEEREEMSDGDEDEKRADDGGEEAWRNAEGERLADFGVDEDVEFYDEDDVPLAQLMRMRRETNKSK